jgi:hypothetical protein
MHLNPAFIAEWRGSISTNGKTEKDGHYGEITSYLKRFPYFRTKHIKNRRQNKKEIKAMGEKEEEGTFFT